MRRGTYQVCLSAGVVTKLTFTHRRYCHHPSSIIVFYRIHYPCRHLYQLHHAGTNETNRTEVGQEAEEIVAQGKLISDELALRVVTSKLDQFHNKVKSLPPFSGDYHIHLSDLWLRWILSVIVRYVIISLHPLTPPLWIALDPGRVSPNLGPGRTS